MFPAGFALDAGAAFLTDAGLDAATVMDGMVNLVTKSLIARDKGNRWYMLETIRAYVLEKLAEGGEQLATTRPHAEYTNGLAAANTTEPVPPRSACLIVQAT